MPDARLHEVPYDIREESMPGGTDKVIRVDAEFFRGSPRGDAEEAWVRRHVRERMGQDLIAAVPLGKLITVRVDMHEQPLPVGSYQPYSVSRYLLTCYAQIGRVVAEQFRSPLRVYRPEPIKLAFLPQRELFLILRELPLHRVIAIASSEVWRRASRRPRGLFWRTVGRVRPYWWRACDRAEAARTSFGRTARFWSIVRARYSWRAGLQVDQFRREARKLGHLLWAWYEDAIRDE